MAEYIEALAHLAEQFGKLEGIGRKTAMRLAYAVLDMKEEDARAFSEAILNARQKIHFCPVCQNLTDRDLCPVCRDETRDRSTVCVVADVKTVNAMEKVREYRGVYHVLHGLMSPVNGVMPEDIRIRELLNRVGEGTVKELIIATNPNIEGEATALYIGKLMRPFGVRVTRLAYGMSVGADLEYVDEVTLSRALEGRRELPLSGSAK